MVKRWQMVFLLALYASALLSKDCGVIGEVYPIAEEDVVVFIQQQLKSLKGTPKYELLTQHLKTNVNQKVDRPHPVSGLSKTETPKTFTVDPSIVLHEPLVNANGQLLQPSGVKINPLSKVRLHNALLFYDADDEEEVAWVMDKITQQHNKVKLILVGGSVSSQANLFKRPVYFDQEGRLTTYFHLTHVPAIVTQKALLLEVSEEKAS